MGQEERTHPTRERKQVKRENYVSSSSAIIGSSSPLYSSSSDYEPDRSMEIDEDVNDERRSKPETLTANLAHSFLPFALTVCLSQNVYEWPDATETRPRKWRKRSTAQVAGKFKLSAEDYGGICLVTQLMNKRWAIQNYYLAIIEAKRTFNDMIFDKKIGINTTVVSDETLAQLLGEAVITWKAILALFFYILYYSSFISILCNHQT